MTLPMTRTLYSTLMYEYTDVDLRVHRLIRNVIYWTQVTSAVQYNQYNIHETRKRRVSCISIQTREARIETRNKHEKSQNKKQTGKLEKLTYTVLLDI